MHYDAHVEPLNRNCRFNEEVTIDPVGATQIGRSHESLPEKKKTRHHCEAGPLGIARSNGQNQMCLYTDSKSMS